MKILVLGDYCFERVFPLLRQQATYIVVVTHHQSEYDRTFYPEVEWKVIPSPLNHSTILRLRSEIEADVILSRVRGTENETEIVEHALAARAVPEHVLFATHPLDFAQITTNKVLFHQFALAHHLPVPRGIICQTPASASLATRQLGGFPIIIKAAISPAGKGVGYIAEEKDFCTYFATHPTGPYLLQECIQGEELGIEIVSSPQGSWHFPIISMDRLDSTLNPQARVRVVPWRGNAELLSRVNDMILVIENLLHPFGPWQIDLALAGSTLFILEVNPRLGGLTNLSYYSTDVDPHVVAYQAVSGHLVPFPSVENIAVELPITRGTELPPVQIQNLKLDIRRARSQPNWRLSISSKDATNIESLIHYIPPQSLLFPVSYVLEKIKTAFADKKE